MGMFGIADVFLSIEGRVVELLDVRMRSVILSMRDIKDSAGPVLRGTVVGFLLGLIPGLTGVVASVVSYIVEKRVAKNPEADGGRPTADGAIKNVPTQTTTRR